MRRPIDEPEAARAHAALRRRDVLVAIGVAWTLVLVRSLVFLAYDHSNFDADQAIYGLMAKHVIEGRAFPLFMYGQQYMLAVDAFIAIPFIAVLGPTIFALHLSIVGTNLAVAAVLVATLVTRAALRPWQAVIATLLFIWAPPGTAASLTEIGGNIGPFLYVPLLWIVRDRPRLFGLLLALGTLAREFTIYALPVILLQQAWTGELWRPARLRGWLAAAIVAVATWQGVQALRTYTDTRGPGTSGLPVAADAAVTTVTERILFAAGELPHRLAVMYRQRVPGLVGASVADTGIARQGHDALFWPFAAIGVIALGWGVLGRRFAADGGARSGGARPGDSWAASFPAFLVGVGILATLGYVVSRPADFFLDRYVLLAVYLPIGLIAGFFASRPPAWLAGLMMASVLVLACGSAFDHVRLAARYWNGREPDHNRLLADELVRRGVTVAMSTYFRAYKLTYYTGERVKVASSDFIRIDEYQRLARAEGDRLLVIADKPCPGGEHFDVWYLCHPGAVTVP